ncbi:TetR/AcrR family transcriptional regulator [Qipengyuania nanhaisediminis]|uniref:TetR/AcrR family transcriptional regulator n=1 Tax=Qipengyuania nanhaisediminis TaxID=604088 RepID=UPI0038B2E54E
MDAPNTQPTQDDTRQALLDAAHRQFAERGFYGASIAQIAGEIGLTKQALLYHFRRKDDLYRVVLKTIADRLLENMRERIDPASAPVEQFADMMLGIYDLAIANPLDVKLLMRELIEDQRRDAPPEEWFFKTFIEEIVSVLSQVEGMEAVEHCDKVARVFMALSAIEYFAAAQSMLTRFYGADGYEGIARAYPEQLRTMIAALAEPGRA